MIEADISTALYKGVSDALISAAITLPVAYPGRQFVPPDTAWIEVVQITNNIANELWGNGRTYQGLLRVLLHYPANDDGAIPATAILDTIANQPTMLKGVQLRSGAAVVTIYDHPDRGSMIVDDKRGGLIFPLTLRYRDFHPV